MVTEKKVNEKLTLMVENAVKLAKTRGVGRTYQQDTKGNMITCIVKIDSKNTKCGYKQYWELNHRRVAKKWIENKLRFVDEEKTI